MVSNTVRMQGITRKCGLACICPPGCATWAHSYQGGDRQIREYTQDENGVLCGAHARHRQKNMA